MQVKRQFSSMFLMQVKRQFMSPASPKSQASNLFEIKIAITP